METKGALLWGPHQDWKVEPLTMGEPVPGEVMVRLSASGLCHSDEHLVTGETPNETWPILGGHEGAGVVESVGAGVTSVKPGDHVIISLPACGHCRPCRRGHQSVCDESWRLVGGPHIADDTYRIKVGDRDASMFCLAGTFAPYTTVHQTSVVKIREDMPLDLAALLGCGITTGWMAASRVAGVRSGDTVIIAGIGGLGSAAILSSVTAGAERVIAIDPSLFKRESAIKLGATHAFESLEEALEPVREMTYGVMADSVILTIGKMHGKYLQPAMNLTAKLGTVAAIGMGDFMDDEAVLNCAEFVALNKTLKGAQMGGASPQQDLLMLVDMYMAGKVPLEDLVTTRYTLEQINDGYQAMREARNLRGLIEYTDADY